MDGCIVAGSDSKKRGCEEFEGLPELGTKRAKVRDLESVLRSEGKFKVNAASAPDLSTKYEAPSCVDDATHLKSGIKCLKPKTFGFDLNTEDVSSSISHDPFHPYNNSKHVKSRDSFSECESSCNLEGQQQHQQQDSMRVWKEMKQNGFLSSSHGGVPMPPVTKSRGRKKGNNESLIKRKIEIAKKEQVDRFTKVAAPSGLLNDLNPGIINHVRNRKQVHSIIENLVKARTGNKHGESKKKGLEKETWNPLYGCQSYSNHHTLNANVECEDDILALKLSSSVNMESMNMSHLSNEESGNMSTVDSLSFKAANVASQWLELLHQDIKGRLAALRRSKKRVRGVIQTELPFLVSRELGYNQENNCYDLKDYENSQFNKENADLHRAKWTSLFDQMDNALCEEEKHLESSLNQVNEMLRHCEHDLLQFHPENGLQQQRTNDYRVGKTETSSYKNLGVQAAAAAIYSTSNFLKSMENLPCF
ncbi:hypothetical protein LXL04_035137 [Taraxacum kok-saghyz]